jgi:PIN domain nuclease of toxin-antitoxin system
MTEKYVFDASALLAILYKENTDKNLQQYLENSLINLVNASEVLMVLQNRGMPKDIAKQVIESTVTEIISITFEESCLAAEIKVQNKKYGISTGDSFCLASGIQLNCPIITADKIWSKLDLDCEIILIR